MKPIVDTVFMMGAKEEGGIIAEWQIPQRDRKVGMLGWVNQRLTSPQQTTFYVVFHNASQCWFPLSTTTIVPSPYPRLFQPEQGHSQDVNKLFCA